MAMVRRYAERMLLKRRAEADMGDAKGEEGEARRSEKKKKTTRKDRGKEAYFGKWLAEQEQEGKGAEVKSEKIKRESE
jgi:hypothetical protein